LQHSPVSAASPQSGPTLADQKSVDILQSLRSTFAAKGFDGASMRDLAQAANMSVGNFYRYFPSKAAIIEALIDADMQRMGEDFAAALQTGNPLARLRSELRSRIADHQCGLDGCLWAEMHAVAHRKPEIGAIMGAMERRVTAHLVEVFALQTAMSPAAAHQAFAPQAALIITLFRSAAMIGDHSGQIKAELTDQIVTAIENTLDAIASYPKKV
jgi:AcrR family transcriptional regulator